MSLFLISLAIVLVAVYVFEHSTDEMAYLAGAISLIGLVVSLVAAPWQVKLLLLMLVLVSSKRLWSPWNWIAKLRRNQQNQPSDRADANEPTSALTKVAEGQITGQQQVQVGQIRNLEKAATGSSTFELKYRGVSIKN